MPKLHKNRKIKRTKGESIIFFIVGVIFFVYAITFIVPCLWMVMSSFKNFVDYTLDLTAGTPFKLPETWVWQNYVDAFEMMEVEGTNFIGMIFNTLWQTFLPMGIAIIVSTAFAYTVSSMPFKGRNFLYGLVVTIMIMPIMTSGGATFKLYRILGIYDTPFAFLTGCFGFGNFFYYYAFFKGVSRSYAEAVYIDGGGEFSAFFKVILPQAASMIGVFCILGFISGWNSYMDVLLYLPSYPSVGSGLYIMKNTFLRTGKDPIYFAGSTVAMLPTLLMFCTFSDKIMTSVSIGGLKG